MVGKLGLGSFFYDTNGDFGALSGGLRYCQVDQRTEAVGFADADLRMPGAGCLPSQSCKLLILNARNWSVFCIYFVGQSSASKTSGALP